MADDFKQALANVPEAADAVYADPRNAQKVQALEEAGIELQIEFEMFALNESGNVQVSEVLKGLRRYIERIVEYTQRTADYADANRARLTQRFAYYTGLFVDQITPWVEQEFGPLPEPSLEDGAPPVPEPTNPRRRTRR